MSGAAAAQRELASASYDPAIEQVGEDRVYRRIGYAIFLVVFVGLGGWSALAPIDSAAIAGGVVAVDSYRKTVQHFEGGIVDALYVVEGQRVAAGEPLLALTGTQYRADLDVLSVQQAALQAEEARLRAERDGRAFVTYPANDRLGAGDARVLEARHTQDTLFGARRKAFDGEVAVLRQRVEQAAAQSTGLRSVIDSKESVLASLRAEIEKLGALFADGFVGRQRLGELERQAATLEGDAADLRSRLAAVASQSGEAELRMLQVERELQAQVAEALGTAQAKLAEVSERLAAAQDRVERTVVRAPVSGRVLGLDVHTVGGVVAAGQPIMQIVPDREQLVVEARVSPADIDRVSAGLPASIRIGSFDRNRVPKLRGSVTDVSADRLLDDKTGAAYFAAKVGIDARDGEQLGGLSLQPGMPAEVMINTGSRTMLEYLWQPVLDSVSRSFRED